MISLTKNWMYLLTTIWLSSALLNFLCPFSDDEDKEIDGSFHVKSPNPHHLTIMDFVQVCQVNESIKK